MCYACYSWLNLFNRWPFEKNMHALSFIFQAQAVQNTSILAHECTIILADECKIILTDECNTNFFIAPLIKPSQTRRPKQGKSEGFKSYDRPIVRKRPIWVKIGDVLSRVTLKFDEWPWKTIGYLSFAVSSFVQHFIAIGEFKLELLFGNA